MKDSIEISGLKITVDPLNKFNTPTNRLIQVCGMVLDWVVSAPSDTKLVPFLDECYVHGGGWFNFFGHTMHEDGRMTYPGDPDLYPIVEVKHGDEIFRQYPYSWVSVTEKDKTVRIARMD